MLHEASADSKGKLLASEILLGLALQRGSLRHLLEWIDMALEASCKETIERFIACFVIDVNCLWRLLLRSEFFLNALVQMDGGKHRLKDQAWGNSGSGPISMYDTALRLLETLSSMAADYGRILAIC